MNKRIAELWVEEIASLLSGKELTVLEIVHGMVPHIRCKQHFMNATVVEHAEGGCVVMINDSYGISPGIQEWNIDPCERTLRERFGGGWRDVI